MTFDVHQLDSSCWWAQRVTLLAILAVRLSSRAGLPSLLIYLLMGVALGEAGLGIQFEDAELAHALGFAALAVILAEGGLTTRWREVKPLDAAGGLAGDHRRRRCRWPSSPSAAHYLLGLPWELAVLLGAVTSPTDAAAVFSVLRVVPLPRRLTGPLEAESGLNDAPTVVLVTLISTGAVEDHGLLGDQPGSSSASWRSASSSGLAVRLRRRLGDAPGGAAVVRPLPARRAHPDLPRRTALRGAVHGSGFAAVYVAALVLGNSELPHRAATRSFAEGVAWLAQIGLFVMLGLLLSPGPDHLGDRRPGGRRPGLVLTFVARPLSVWLSAVAHADAPARAGVPVLGRTARRGPDRAHHHPARRGGRPAPSGCSTSSS